MAMTDPLCSEVIAVPAAGVERWLAQHVSGRIGSSGRGDGIAANIDFCSPTQLADRITRAVAAGPGGGSVPSVTDSPWRTDALVFAVLRVLDDMLDDPRMALLARHLGRTPETADDAHRTTRRYATARHIADLFSRYGHSRPTMLAEWAVGADTDGVGRPVPVEMAWQPEFWRRVRARIAEPHPAETLGTTCALLRGDPECVSTSVVPERVSLFGPTRITASMLEVLSAVSVHRDVHVFVPHPSPALWSAITELAADRIADGPEKAVGPVRRASRPAPGIAHPLLASLSRDVQELQLRLAPLVDHDHHHRSRHPASTTTLGTLQGDTRDDVALAASPADADRQSGSPLTDTSIEVHACHGPERQVEVLRDRILHLFADDTTLEPRDVLIMCPDIETFAPLIRGAFGQPGLGHPAFDLRVRLADRGLRHTNAVLDVVASVVELAAGRVSAGDVVDLLSRPPVRARFSFTDDDLDMIREWLSAANIRWAIDDTQRTRSGLADFAQQTFEAGVDRIVLGVVADEDGGQWLDRALPLAGVDSTHIDLVGRFAEFIDRLARVLRACLVEHSVEEWAELLTGCINELTATDRDDEWQRAQAIRTITTALEPDDGEDAITLRLGDVRDLVTAMVAARPTRANFRTGELTVCSMVPMRSVPHRVIILLGVDAEAFPRSRRTDGDDILGVDPLIGERNPRDEDRQMFLDALCAAGDNLIVFYTGADPVSGARVPPAVVVSELVDCVAGIRGVDPTAVIIRHTLHGFDAANFTAGAIPGVPGPFGFDPALLDGARALQAEPVAAEPISAVALPALQSDDVELADLIAFLTNPFDAFLRQRLGARLTDDERPHADELDIDLDALSAWSIGDRFLSQMLAGADLATCQAAELRRGTLPPFAFGTRALADISDRVGRLHDAVVAARTGSAVSLDAVAVLPDGRRVHGTVADVYDTSIITATYSTLRAKQRLSTWIRLLLLGAAGSAVTQALVIGRKGGKTSSVSRSLLAMPDDPAAILYDLVRVREGGLRRPLPMPIDCAVDFVERHTTPARMPMALQLARRSFDRDFGASADRALRFLYTGDPTTPVDFDALLAEPTPASGDYAGVPLPSAPGEPLFCGVSHVVWGPLLTHETAG